MTIIAGIKDYTGDGGIYIGCDGVGSDGNQTRPNLSEKLWRQKEFLIGISGSYRVGQAIRYQFRPPPHEDHMDTNEYIYGLWVPSLVKALREAQVVSVLNEVAGIREAFALIGYRNRLFTLQNDFSMIEEMDGLHTIGAGYMVCLGALKASTKKKPKKRLEEAMQITGSIMPGLVGPPYTVEEL